MMYSRSLSSTTNATILDDHDETFADYLRVHQSKKQSKLYPDISDSFVDSSIANDKDQLSVSPILSPSSSSRSNYSTRSSMSSFIKIPSPHAKTNELSSLDDPYVVTIMSSPSERSQNAASVPDKFSTSEESSSSNFLRNKVTAALNHMKYRWAVKMRPNFRTSESPVYCLGKVYNDPEQTFYDDIPHGHNHHEFLEYVTSRIYFSYRKSFKPLASPKTSDSITTDGGWGCMIRCAQMLLAQSLLLQWTTTNQVHPNRINVMNSATSNLIHQRTSNLSSRSLSPTEIYTRIIRLFGDYPDPQCPFGIHKIVELGIGHGIRVGEFFGPSSAAHCLKEAMEIAVEKQLYSDTFRVYISRDAIVYRQDVYNLFDEQKSTNQESIYPPLTSPTQSENNEAPSNSRSVLILIPLRLGLNELDLVYEEYLKEALRLPQTVGIIGGSPRHAVYIIGFQDNSFIDLDPHLIQNTVNVLAPNYDLSSYSCSTPKTLSARKMDPSCTLGFYCRDKADFEMFCAQWNRVCHLAPDGRRACPMFRTEPGTFEENQNRLLNGNLPSMTTDTSLILRVTKVPNSNPGYSLTDPFQMITTNLINSNTNTEIPRESWDDSDRSFNQHQYSQSRSITDDYVFL